MRFITFLLTICLVSFSVWAQNTETSSEQLLSPKLTMTLEAKVVQIVLNDEHRQGVDWEAIVSDFHSLQLKKEGDLSLTDNKYKLSIGQVSNDDYAILLEALDTVGHVSQTDFPEIVLNKDEPKNVDISTDVKTLQLPVIHLDLFWFPWFA